MVKIDVIGDEKKPLEEPPPPTNNGLSSTTGGEDQQSPENKQERLAQAKASVQNLMMFNNDLDKKWVQYVNKIFNALHNMDK